MNPAEIVRSVPEADFAIHVREGSVSFPAGDMPWQDAHRVAVEIRDAAQAARTLQDLRDREAEVDTCAVCDAPLRPGVVAVEDEAKPGRRRHAEGSPECKRR